MQYRRLGASGLQLSALSFGAWVTFGNQVGRGEARELIAAAWDHGINFFDNAETYSNGEAERVMGDALADLRVDYLDLFFCHRPDPDTPIAETVWAMDTLVRQG